MAFAQVILREKIAGLGAESDIVRVRAGYARNFLLPQKKAYEATPGNLRHVEQLKTERVKREADELVEAEKISGKVKKLRLNLKLATGATGKAFGSITASDIAKAINAELGTSLDRHQIQIAGPIKTLGKHDIVVKLHSEVAIDLTITVAAEGAKEEKADTDADEGKEKAKTRDAE